MIDIDIGIRKKRALGRFVLYLLAVVPPLFILSALFAFDNDDASWIPVLLLCACCFLSASAVLIVVKSRVYSNGLYRPIRFRRIF